MRRAMRMVVLALLLAGCTAPPAGPPAPPPVGPPVPPSEVPEAAVLELARSFDGERALALVRLQIHEGPCAEGGAGNCSGAPNYRIPGSPGSNHTAAVLRDRLSGAGFAARPQEFTATFEGTALPAQNVVGERGGSKNATLYLGAHFDTRPCADKDPDPTRRPEPVLGANDGASGVAVLLHLAERLHARALNLTLRLVFFDAEDLGDAGLGCGRGTPWAQGSAHYAQSLSAAEVERAFGMVLVDMVGDARLELRREGHSARAPHRELQDDLWRWAARLGHTQFRNETSSPITDDHVPFQARGIRSTDIIHLDGGPDVFPDSHHTTFDDLDHVSAASLEAVGETLLAAVLAWDAEAGRTAQTV